MRSSCDLRLLISRTYRSPRAAQHWSEIPLSYSSRCEASCPIFM